MTTEEQIKLLEFELFSWQNMKASREKYGDRIINRDPEEMNRITEKINYYTQEIKNIKP